MHVCMHVQIYALLTHRLGVTFKSSVPFQQQERRQVQQNTQWDWRWSLHGSNRRLPATGTWPHQVHAVQTPAVQLIYTPAQTASVSTRAECRRETRQMSVIDTRRTGRLSGRQTNDKVGQFRLPIKSANKNLSSVMQKSTKFVCH